MLSRVSHRWSGRVAAAVLLPLLVICACGSRDNLFVLDDEPGGSGGRAGGVNSGGGGNGHGGHAGTSSGGFGAVGAFGGTGFNTGGFGMGGVGFAGGIATGGMGAIGGSVGSAGFGNGAGFGGTAGFSCEACLAQKKTNPCLLARCDFMRQACIVSPQNDGSACAGEDRCAPGQCKAGVCVGLGPVVCPPAAQCMNSACDPMTGQCVSTPQTGTACDDGDPCTLAGQCVMGKCTPGAPLKTCQNNDKCCPAGCVNSNDNDCPAQKQITLDATNRGWYDALSFHDAMNKNTFTGFSPPFQYDSFFSFDLSSVSATIVSAQLVLEEESYFGSDASETASVWDVTASAAVLAAGGTQMGVFQDLQSGHQYGTFSGAPTDLGTALAIKTIKLSGTAVADLNAARGKSFSVGVHIDTLSGQHQQDEGLRFSQGTEPRQHQLILTVQ
jgi:hypothetical protein